MKQVTNRVYILTQVGYINAYVVLQADGGITVVDTGMNATFIDKIASGLATIGKSLDEVRHIFITHCHYDHIGGLAALQARTNATTYVGEQDAPVVRGEIPPHMPDPDTLDSAVARFIRKRITPPAVAPARVDELLQDGQALPSIAPDAKAIYLGGHSMGQHGLWLEDERTLIGGDVLMRFPTGLTMPIYLVSPDWVLVKKSIRSLEPLQVKTLCLGHGTPIVGDAHTPIARFIQRIKN